MEVVDDKIAPVNWQMPVTLPSTPCEGCALQLIQCMTPPGEDPATAACSNYYSCANITLVAADGDAGPGGPDAGAGGPDGGAGGPDGGGGGQNDDPSSEAPGLCAAAPGGQGGSIWLVFGLAGFALGLWAARRSAHAPARIRSRR
jgi:hypothetical protein